MHVVRIALSALLLAAMVAVDALPAQAQQQSFWRNFLDSLGDTATASLQSGRPMYPEDVSRMRVVPFKYRRATVRYDTREKPGTIVIDTRQHFLYFVLGNGMALRYGVGVGREGFGWRGAVRVGNKREWPDWYPPKEMIARERKRGHKLPDMMPGGEDNPLGARALYLHGKSGDTGYRIHGTREPWTIGLNVSSGCIRLNNNDVIDLYNRTQVGAKVVVL
jgi:lipoprotein-anchoring transpeptidase ErfK/SrfK